MLGVLFGTISLFSIREYLRIIFGSDDRPVSKTIRVISYITSIGLIFAACKGSLEYVFLGFVINFVALSVFVLARFSKIQGIFEMIAKQVLGIIYIPVSLALLIIIKGFEGGTWWVIWLMIVIFANDTGAFYTGTFLGRKKLSPSISPNKTIEGSIGGAVAGMITGFIFCQIFFSDFSLSLITLPAAFVLAIAGQVGDLFESAMKRASSIKDSGRILPGHGGMLDRIDGLLLAIPLLYIYLVYIL